jgi:hypothetical protein
MTDASETSKQETPASPDGFCEIVDEEDIYPNHHEFRIPDCGAPYPDGLNDPGSRDLVDTARWFLSSLLVTFWSPAALARLETVWQWRKFDFLDWLRPIELLLRRLLLIEALGLLLSQALPPLRSGSSGKVAPRPRPAPSFDPDYPETWRVCFTVIPPVRSASRQRTRRRLPPVHPRHIRGQPQWRLRSRRVLHGSVPLALRLEAVIRVTLEPGKYARRLALRLQRRRNPNLSLLIIPRARPFPRPAPREALLVAGDRAAALHHAWWSSA